LHDSSSSNVGEGIAAWEAGEREARKQIKQEWEVEARESKKEIVALFASWVRMGMAMVSSTASAAPASALERLGLECCDGVDRMGLTPEPPCSRQH